MFSVPRKTSCSALAELLFIFLTYSLFMSSSPKSFSTQRFEAAAGSVSTPCNGCIRLCKGVQVLWCDADVSVKSPLSQRGGCTVTLDSRGVFSPFVPKLQHLVHTQKRAACFPIKTGSSATRPFLEIRYSFQCVCLEALGYLNHFLVYFPRHKRYHV